MADFTGTLKQGVKNIKAGVKGGKSSQDYSITYNEERDTHILIGPDGSSVGSFDSRKAAAAKARELKRESGTSEMTQTNTSSEDERGRLQQFATSFSSKVNETVEGASEDGEADNTGLGFLTGGMDDDSDGPILPGMEMDGSEDDGGPMLPGFGGNDQDAPMLPNMGMKDESEGSDSGPQLAGFGMWDDPDNDDDGENDYNFPGF